jgi:hypothetical protein
MKSFVALMLLVSFSSVTYQLANYRQAYTNMNDQQCSRHQCLYNQDGRKFGWVSNVDGNRECSINIEDAVCFPPE